MKLSIIVSALTLSVLPFSIASAIRPRDDMNNVLVGYYDGNRFATETVPLTRSEGVMKGFKRFEVPDPRSSEPSGEEEDLNVYYAEIVRGPPNVVCRFLVAQQRVSAPYSVVPYDLFVFTASRPFIPYNRHITGAVGLICQVWTDGEELEQ